MRTVFFLIALSVAPGVNAAAASLQPPNCALGVTWPIKGAGKWERRRCGTTCSIRTC